MCPYHAGFSTIHIVLIRRLEYEKMQPSSGCHEMLRVKKLKRARTVNVTGETLVLDKNLPSIKQGFAQLSAGKVGKMRFVPT